MKKSILSCLLVLGIGFCVQSAYADRAMFDMPVTPAGTSDNYAGTISSCVTNSSGLVLIYARAASTNPAGVLYTVATSTGDAGDFLQVFDASAAVVTLETYGNVIVPRTGFPVAGSGSSSETARLERSIAGGRGVRFENGLMIRLTGTSTDASDVCLYYLTR